MPEPRPAPETPSGQPEPAAGWSLPRLRVDRDGAWFDGDVEITHAGILADLRATLRRDARGYFIQTRVRIPVEVEDAPFVVERVERRGDRLHVWLNDGTETDLDPAGLRMGEGGVPYGAVKDGVFDARFSRAAAFQLLALAEPEERTGDPVLRLGGRAFTLRRES